MGKIAEIKPNTPRRVKLPPAAYWELRAKQRDLDVLQAEAQQRLQAADAVVKGLLQKLGAEHGFDHKQVWIWVDDTCELVQQVPEK